jgi:hypothetical protein
MTRLTRDLPAAPRSTSTGVASQPSTDVHSAPRWGHALWMLSLISVLATGLWSALFAAVYGSGLLAAAAGALVLVSLAALWFEDGAGQMDGELVVAPAVVGCTVCGSVVPRAQASYDDVFGFVCEDCEIPEEAA